jgi:3-oxoacyl-ACP reductase-like protein
VQATLLLSESVNGPSAVVTADHIIAQSSSTAASITGTAATAGTAVAGAGSSTARQQFTNAFATLAKLQSHVLTQFQLPILDQVPVASSS